MQLLIRNSRFSPESNYRNSNQCLKVPTYTWHPKKCKLNSDLTRKPSRVVLLTTRKINSLIFSIHQPRFQWSQWNHSDQQFTRWFWTWMRLWCISTQEGKCLGRGPTYQPSWEKCPNTGRLLSLQQDWKTTQIGSWMTWTPIDTFHDVCTVIRALLDVGPT